MNFNILADKTLPQLTNTFQKPFQLTMYNDVKEIPKLLYNQDVLLCRSTIKINKDLLNSHKIGVVATASSGVDHIDLNYLSTSNIRLLDAKGSNATAVADYVLATIAYLQKHHGLTPKKALVIGVGYIGLKVVQRLLALQINTKGYDPLQTGLAQNLTCENLDNLNDYDLICVHANLHNTQPFPSINLLDDKCLRQLKPGTIIINASRGGIINEEALLKQKNSLIYCTDVYNNEPFIDPNIVDFATICTPHIAGHSIESRLNAVNMLSKKIHAYYHCDYHASQLLQKINPQVLSEKTWQDLVLSIFNPALISHTLKTAANKTQAFLNLRASLHLRHDFCNTTQLITKQTRHLLEI